MIDLSDKSIAYCGQNFKNLELAEATLIAKEFDNCVFTECNFSEAKFYQCKFNECKFVNCNLSTLDVKDSYFLDVTFEECKAIGINWTRAKWPTILLTCPIHFYKCILNYSSFFGLNIREIVMTECLAHDVDFKESDCTEANFMQTDFQNSFFNKTNLTKADFTDAINYNIDIFSNQLKKAKFSLPEAENLLRSLDIELIS